MNPMKTLWTVLLIGIISVCCQTASAEVVPPHPNHSWLFDEGIGNTATPHAGGNDAVLEDGAVWSDKMPFDYAGNHSVNVTEGAVTTLGFPLGAAGTISMWAQSHSYGAHRYLLDSGIARTLLDVNLNGDEEVIYINGQPVDYGQADWANSDSFSIDEWHHIAITWDDAKDTKVRIYLDGALKTTANNCGDESTPNNWYFGKSSQNDTDGWQGQIDEYAFWNQALSPDEVVWLSNHSLVGLPEPSSLFLAAIGLIGLVVFGRRKRV